MTINLPEGDVLLKRIWGKLPRPAVVAALSALGIGGITHLYMITNHLPNHDTIVSLFSRCDLLTSGRWFQFVPAALSGRFCVSWIIVLISLIAIALSSAVIVMTLRIQKTFWVALTSAVIVTFPAVANTFGYLFSADAYFVAVFFAALGAYLAERGWLGVLAGGALLGLSMGVYQAYIFFAITLMGMRGVMLLLDPDTPNRTIWIRLLQYVGALAVGAIVNKVGLEFMLWYRGVELSDYQGIDALNDYRLYLFFQNAGEAYRTFYRFLTQKTALFIQPLQRAALWIISIGVVALTIAHAVRAGRLAWFRYVLAALILAGAPLMLCGVSMIADFTHELMYLPMCLVFVFAIALYETLPPAETNLRRQATIAAGYLLALVTAFASVQGALYTNNAYMALQLEYEQAHAIANRMVDRIEQCPEYTHDTPVYFAGSLYQNYDVFMFDGYGSIANTIAFDYGSFAFGLDDDDRMRSFVQAYIGRYYLLPEEAALAPVLESSAYREMPAFPAAGSVAYIDGIIIVKMSASD